MTNKNDLRYVKTERLIEETYILLKEKSSTPIKVSELCQVAQINKTTFYTHYENIEMLHEHVCRKVVYELLENCPYMSEAFINTESFVLSVVDAMKKQQKILLSLFGSNSAQLVNIVEEVLLRLCLHGNEPPEKEILIRFAIGGASHLLIPDYSDSRVKITVALIKKLF